VPARGPVAVAFLLLGGCSLLFSPDGEGGDGGCEEYAILIAAEEGLALWHRMEDTGLGVAIDSHGSLHGRYDNENGRAAIDFGVEGPGGTGHGVRFHATPDVSRGDIGGSSLRLAGAAWGFEGSFPWFEEGPYTLELWYRDRGTGEEVSSLAFAEEFPVRGFRLRLRHDLNLLQVLARPGSLGDEMEVGAGAPGAWHHLVMTVEPLGDVQRVALYVDGELAGEEDWSWTPVHQCDPMDCTTVARVGSGQEDGAALDMDEFAVYEGLLSPASIAAHERAGRVACP
jgi:hypothetical protein